MRVLLVDQFSELGGAQRGLLEAVEGFVERGWELHAAVPEGPLAECLRPHCASVATISCGPFESVHKNAFDVLRFASQFRGLSSALSPCNADVLYVNGPRVLPAAAWARRNRPVVFHSHSVVAQRSAAQLAGKAIGWSNAEVIVSSQFVARWLTPFVAADRLRVIYNGIRDMGRSPRPRAHHTRIGMLGRIAPEKGQLTFVRAARIASQADRSLSFVLCGAPVFGSQSYSDQVRAEAGPQVRFDDWTEDIGGFFDKIDVLVVPSEAMDANPRVIPEAYAAGVPVIAFDSGGISELLLHEQTGMLVQERLAEVLAAAMLKSVQAPALLNRLAANGHQRWQKRYTLARFQSEVCEVLERTVARHRTLAKASA